MQDDVTDSRVQLRREKEKEKESYSSVSNFVNHRNTYQKKKAVFEVIRCDDVIDSVIAIGFA